MKKIEVSYLNAKPVLGIDGLLVVSDAKGGKRYVLVEAKTNVVRTNRLDEAKGRLANGSADGTMTSSIYVYPGSVFTDKNGTVHHVGSGKTRTFLDLARRTENIPSAKRVYSPPGVSLSRLAEFFASPKTMERVLQPILSDLLTEYFNALAEGRRFKAEWVRLRGYWSFWIAVGLHSVVSLVVKVWQRIG
jgi:hypothetical protein